MATYSDMVKMVRDWSNRDTEVISNEIIKNFIQFAADGAYRDLRIAPLEEIVFYNTITDSESGQNELPVPGDAIEFIQLRKKDVNSTTGYVVYSAKADVRSFYEQNTHKYDYYYYTREKDKLILYPEFATGDEYELFYYARKPATYARYNPVRNTDPENVDVSAFQYGPFDSTAELVAGVRDAEGADVFTLDPDLMSRIENLAPVAGDSEMYLGTLTPNWLRDQNEKVILFGALMECFQYLNEPETTGLYAARFANEIQRLNDEENQRKYMGGNINVGYYSNKI